MYSPNGVDLKYCSIWPLLNYEYPKAGNSGFSKAYAEIYGNVSKYVKHVFGEDSSNNMRVPMRIRMRVEHMKPKVSPNLNSMDLSSKVYEEF